MSSPSHGTMAAVADIPVGANILGTIGTILWCIQLVPQIWHNWRHKKTDGFPAAMRFLWALCMLSNDSPLWFIILVPCHLLYYLCLSLLFASGYEGMGPC